MSSTLEKIAAIEAEVSVSSRPYLLPPKSEQVAGHIIYSTSVFADGKDSAQQSYNGPFRST